MRVVPFALLAALATSSCRNPCQDLCVQMKLFAEDCGHTVPDSELDACIAEQELISNEAKDTCREDGDLGTIEQTWDCDTIAVYWGAGTGS